MRPFSIFFLAGLSLVAIDNRANAELLVANGGDGTVSRINSSGAVTGSFNTGLGFPTGIAVDKAGAIYVGDGGNGPTVNKYSPAGTNLGVFATVPHAFATGAVAIDRSGVLWAGGWDSGDGSLHRFSSTGASLGSFGHVFYNDPNIGFGGASFFGVAFDSHGDVVAADDFFEAIYRFAPDGTLLQAIHTGSFFDPNDPFSPFSVAIDGHDNIYIGGDGRFGGEIREYSNSGVYLQTLVSNLGDVFGTVAGLTIGPDGSLYATEFDTGIVERFSPDGTDLGVFASGLNGPIGLVFTVPEPGSFVLGSIVLIVSGGVQIFRRRRDRAH